MSHDFDEIIASKGFDTRKIDARDEYAFLGTLDSRTCDRCGGLDGKHYPVGKEKVGVNYPPLHPYCRCTTVPWFDDDEDLGERIARGFDGKNYYVSADISYEEWKSGLSEDEHGKMDLQRKMGQSFTQDKNQYERVQKILGVRAPKSLDVFRYLKYNDIEDWNEIKTLLRSKNYLQEQLPYFYHGEKHFIPQFTKFDDVKVIAGQGSETPIRTVERLVDKHGGEVSSWQKKVARVTSAKYTFDIHWYELNGVQYETKLKSRSERKDKSK